MIEIKDLLLGFSDLILREETKKSCIKNSILKATRINISEKDIKIKNKTIYLNIKPIYKNEVFLKLEEIRDNIQKELGREAPKEIR
ncbi:hypothetical protein A2647_01380 [Candidatus Nomurabacteria bacterium RIFCSPHIGHO2_01_FULL_40_24b]|uniref:Uncharacterized protein n=1 Tax=Candidatus Nomurabacteria bacterium RIFCSPHIGHO2_01_FULL_40_24b TaxID=1801739 RepID=A0A1F6V6H0_9BACT|nr:MAG: hypothetical protein A2647_01380 [Candidatus Nomurabacteria bacterium RIFCSPHIGHO2_01_FULL_40_24b]